jgi:hypothetical protein
MQDVCRVGWLGLIRKMASLQILELWSSVSLARTGSARRIQNHPATTLSTKSFFWRSWSPTLSISSVDESTKNFDPRLLHEALTWREVDLQTIQVTESSSLSWFLWTISCNIWELGALYQIQPLLGDHPLVPWTWSLPNPVSDLSLQHPLLY